MRARVTPTKRLSGKSVGTTRGFPRSGAFSISSLPRRGWCGWIWPCALGARSLSPGHSGGRAARARSPVRPQSRGLELDRDCPRAPSQSLLPAPSSFTSHWNTNSRKVRLCGSRSSRDICLRGPRLGDLLVLKEAADRVAGLRPTIKPILDAISVEFDLCRLLQWVVGSYHF